MKKVCFIENTLVKHSKGTHSVYIQSYSLANQHSQ